MKFIKDPDNDLPCWLDLSQLLAGDTIASVTTVAESGITVADLATVTETTTRGEEVLPALMAITFTLQGGTVGVTGYALFRLTTTMGRTLDYSITVAPRDA